ncbi:MAG: hypothetical protein H0V22_06895, partial [Solirubrobacterales bacterium]|nr:hypothetical protein [Solirubrobacterales bacterium]
ADNSTVETQVGAVSAGSRIAVCVRDHGTAPIALVGSPRATLAGRLKDPNLRAMPAFIFTTDEPVAVDGKAPAIVRRMALFKLGRLGGLTFWALLSAVAIGLPLLLAGGARAAYTSERS